MAENVNTKPGCSKDDTEYMDIESGLDFLNASRKSNKNTAKKTWKI